tara:strand:- start:4767 stop:5516 length:750 start_codon:yes stop_codon:yes gene_type:complete
MSYNLFGWQLFKSEEEKKKEYEDNIATNIAAMEVQDRANKSTAYSNDPRFLQTQPIEKRNILNTGNYHYSGLGGNISPIPGPFSVKRETTPENAAEVREAYNTYNQNLLNPIYDIVPWGNKIKPLPVDVNSVKVPPKTIVEKINKLTSQRWTPAIQKEIDVLQQGITAANPIGSGQAIKDIYLSGDPVAKAAASSTGGMDYLSLLKILGMVNAGNQTQRNVKPAITPGITPAVAGAKIQDEDLYAKYRR